MRSRKIENIRTKSAVVCVSAFALALVAACSAPREPVFADPSLLEITTKELVLMPVVDQRENRMDQFDVGRHVRSAADRVLAKKGYTVLTSRLLEGAERPPFEGFAQLSAAELSKLGPADSKMLLFIAVDGVSHAYDRFGDEYYVRVSGILVDRDLSRVIWRDNGSGDTNFGGLLSVMSPAGSQYDAVYEALTNLFRTVPDVPKDDGKRSRIRS